MALLFSCGTVRKVDIPLLNLRSHSEEEKIISMLDSVEMWLERKNVKKVMEHVSMQYRDDEGRNYESLRLYLQRIVRDYKTIRVTRTLPEVKVQGDTAIVIDTFGTVAEPYDPVQDLPVNIQGKVQITMVKEREEWKILSFSPLL